MDKPLKIILSALSCGLAVLLICAGLWKDFMGSTASRIPGAEEKEPQQAAQMPGIEFGGAQMPEAGSGKTGLRGGNEYVSKEPIDMEKEFQTDTSTGTYTMSDLVEYKGKFYYSTRGNSFWFSVWRCNVDGSETELFLDHDDEEDFNTSVINMIPTEQYIYIEVISTNNPLELSHLYQFTEDGIKVGSIYIPGTHCKFSNGYFYYYDRGNLCRKKAEAGSEPERVADEYVETLFQINKGYLYYITRDGELMCSNVDGTDPVDVSNTLGQGLGLQHYEGLMSNGFYDDHIYFWNKIGYESFELYRVALDGSQELIITAEDGGESVYSKGVMIDHLVEFKQKTSSGNVIGTYDLNTGEKKILLQVPEGKEYHLLPVNEASRIYYFAKESGYGDSEATYHSITLDGTSQADYGTDIATWSNY